MTIDINRLLISYYGYMNILNTITQLNEQLPIHLMNEVSGQITRERDFNLLSQHMLGSIYKTMLYMVTWNYSPDVMTTRILDRQVKSLLQNRFLQFYHNPVLEQFQVRILLIDFQRKFFFLYPQKSTENSLAKLESIIPTRKFTLYQIIAHPFLQMQIILIHPW